MIYETLFRRLPKRYMRWIKDYLRYSDFTIKPEKYGGFSVFYGFLLGLVLFSVLAFVSSIKIAIIISVFSFLLFEALMHSILILVSDSRAKTTEEILPDALRLMASNIKSGLTPDKALILSARPEFGPLEKGIRKAAKLTISGKPTEEAIQSISMEINSKALKRTVDLLAEGMRRGGNLVHLLEGLADDIRQSKILKREIKSFVMMYVIFIFFAAGIGAPLLYAISSYLVQTMTTIGSNINIEGGVTGGMQLMTFKGVELDQGFLRMYSLLSIGITSLFGGMLIGLVQEGSERAGIKYIPVLLLVSVFIYFLSSMLVTNVFGTIF